MDTEAAGARSATRVDAKTGVSEQIEFRGPGGRRMFSCTYLPQGPVRAAVLICPPIHGEFTRNYRREVLLARSLAGEGFAVERFHYRGTGNSDGAGGTVTFETMREDTLECVEHLEARAGTEQVVLFGTRWGGLIAASAAAMYPRAALALWEPLLDTSRFFRDAFRTRIVFERKSGVEHATTGEELVRRLQADGSIDVVGHTIERGLFESSTGRTLEGELGSTPRPLLVIQIGPSNRVRTELSSQVDRWRIAGFQVDLETVVGDETWWLFDERWHDEGRRPMTRHLIDSTTTWMSQRSAERAPR